jgi:hypothetical protein
VNQAHALPALPTADSLSVGSNRYRRFPSASTEMEAEWKRLSNLPLRNHSETMILLCFCICVLILLICVLIPHTTANAIWPESVLMLQFNCCPHTTIYVSSYLILRPTLSDQKVSSYYYTVVFILLYVSSFFMQDQPALWPEGHRQGVVQYRPAILEGSQPVKNRNLNRLIENLSRLNWSSECNSVYCFSTVFTLLQQQKYPWLVYPVIFPV